MKNNLAILASVLFVAGVAHAQPAPEATPPAPAADPAAAPPAGDAAPTSVEPAAVEPVAPVSESATAEMSAAADASATAEMSADSGGAEMSAEELAQLGLGGEAATVDTSIHLSGFVDFGVTAGLSSSAEAVTDAHRSFAVGNVNLYLSKNLTETFRSMIELRFMYLPNGAGPELTSPPMNTQVTDYADFARTIKWGGIEIQRVYLDWSAFSFLTLRLGQYLTPYGVWNVDHGTPTIIPAAKPYVIGAGFFPQRQTGLELYGRTDAGDDGAIGYHLTLSNGTGSVTEYKDLDSNKALGARAYWETRALGELRLGGSAYYGTESRGSTALGIMGTQLTANEVLTAQSDMLAFGVDAVWKISGLHVQAEWLSLQRKFTDEGRIAMMAATGGTSFPADSFSWGMYALLGYRFDWYGIMPFVMYQNLEQPDRVAFHGYHVGVNIRPIDALAVKVQYDDVTSGEIVFRIGYVQVAWAF